MRAEDFAKLRGFNPAYINGCEDLDLCFRLREMLRGRSLYMPSSTVYHLESRTAGRGKFISRNRDIFINRWKTSLPDDQLHYTEDGYAVVHYEKVGREVDGPAALYFPTLKKQPSGVKQEKVFNVGFCSIWHMRGITFHTKQIADALEGDFIKTHIFARWESEKFQNTGVVRHPRVFNAGDDPSADEIVRWVRENEIDCVVFMEVHPNDWKRAKALKDAGITIVCYENMDILRICDIQNYDIFDVFLFNAFFTREFFLKHFPTKRSIMVPWASDVPCTNPLLDGDKVDFVHIAGWGGLNNRKNTDLTIKAFDAARVSAKLHIYTQASIEKYGTEITHICRANKNISVVTGTLDNISQAYRNKDVLLWPSKREGVGLPVIEALASGLTVVISDGYMMKQWIVPEVHGVVCSGRPLVGKMALPEIVVDEQSLTDCIRDFAGNPRRVRKLREAVLRDRDNWVWSWQKVVLKEQFAQLLRDTNFRPSECLEYLPEEAIRFELGRKEATAQVRSETSKVLHRLSIRSLAADNITFWQGVNIDLAEVSEEFSRLNTLDAAVCVLDVRNGCVAPRAKSDASLSRQNKFRMDAYVRHIQEATHGTGISTTIALFLDDTTLYDSATVPLFSFQKNSSRKLILLPDIDFLQHDFYEAEGYADRRRYAEKHASAIFAGATTGAGAITLEKLASGKVNRINSALFFRGNPRVQFFLPKIVQCASDEVGATIAAMELGTNRISWEEQLGHRFILSMDGNGATCSRIALGLASNSVLAKYRSPNVLYYFSRLVPGEHYVDLGGDIDVGPMLDAEAADPMAFERIASRGTDFYREYLTRSSVIDYTASLLDAYSEMVPLLA
jgi:glycosyltransferase involved in cell wall biosynthesis